MPKSPRNRSRRWDIPSIIRVEDKSNVITSSATLGRAVGWAKIQIRALNRLLRGPENKKSLPYRTFHYAMPVGGISRITIWTEPRDGTWRVRIIGESSEFGNFIWIPTSGPDFPDDFRDQILVKAEGFGGPYNVEIKPDLIAKRIDWKGFTRTKDAQGNALPRPVTDVLTWEGPGARYINYGGLSPLGNAVYKNGVEYITTKELPERGPNFSFKPPGDFVVGAAIQGTFGSPEGRRDVMITLGDWDQFGGTQGVGETDWDVWVRTENGTDGEFEPPITGRPSPSDPVPNPDGWKHIARIDAPDAINGERYLRMPVWFFNQSGTEASLMLPVQNGGWRVKRNNFQSGATPANFAHMDLTLATLSIDAFAETATAVFNSTWEPRQTEINTGLGGTLGAAPTDINVSGTTTTFCEGCPVGEIVMGMTRSGTIEYGSEVRRIAVDYKGDTRVFATVTPREDGGVTHEATGLWTRTFHAGAGSPCDQDNTFTGNLLRTDKLGWDVHVGSAIFKYRYQDRVIEADASTYSDTRTDEHNLHFVGGIQWMDLRNDLIVCVEPLHGMNTSITGSVSEVFANGTVISGGTAKVRVRYGPITRESRSITGTKAVRGSTTLVEHQEKVDGEPVIGGQASFDFPITTPFADTEVVTSGNFCRLRVPVEDRPTTISTISTWGPGNATVVPVEPRTRELNGLTLESMTATDQDLIQGIGRATSTLMPSGTATDTAGNVALSIRTYSGRASTAHVDGVWPGPPWLNYIDGDDMIDVMNQVTYVDPGPDDVLGTADDFDLDPIDETGRADAPSAGRSSTIFIL